MHCEEAMDLITDFILDKPVTREMLQAILEHINHCKRCTEELNATVNLLTGEPFKLQKKLNQSSECSEYGELFPECAELSEESLKREYPHVWNHLRGCTSCQEDFVNLQQMIREAAVGGFGPEPDIVTFGDLLEVRHREPLWKQIKEGMRCLTVELKIMIEKNKATFYELPLLLRPCIIAPVVVRDDRGIEQKKIQQLSIPDLDRGFEITLTSTGSAHQEGILYVRLLNTKNARPVPGAEAKLFTLLSDSLFELDSSITQQDGMAAFPNLKPDHYVIQIQHGNHVWQIRANLTTQQVE
jgi:hypothetical protein